MGIDIICEIVLYSLSLLIAIYSSYTDIKYHVVKNKALLCCFVLAIPFILIYYLYCNRMMIGKYVINVIVCSFISLLLYHLKIWGGGDSKLFILIVLCIPARLYYFNYNNLPLLEFPIFVFSFGYLYLFAESMYLYFKKHQSLKLPTKEDIISFIQSYLFLSVYMIFLSEILRRIMPSYYYNNVLFFWIICSMFSILFSEYEIFHNKYLFLVVLILDIFLKANNTKITIYPYVIVFILFLLKTIISAHNYRRVNIEKIKEGDVLSSGSVMMFQSSRIKNLPNDLSENLSARLSKENVEAIGKWSKSHKQVTELTIVAKIPFVIFILFGYIYFIILEVLR